MPVEYKLQRGYGYKRESGRPWRDAPIVVVPDEVAGTGRVMYTVQIDGAACVVFATARGLFAQMKVACVQSSG